MSVKYYAFIAYCAIIGAALGVESTDELEEYRLPETAIPLSYHLMITPNFETFTFKGKVRIGIEIKFTTNVIKLHSKNLNIETVKFCEDLKPKIKEIRHENDILVVEYQEAIPFNTKVCLTIDFNGILNDDKKGFYKINYKDNGEENWLAITSLHGTYAREVFPCFDEPRFRTPFLISIQRNFVRTSRSNMPITKTYSSKDDRYVWDEFKTTPPIPTYLVSFMVGELLYLKNSANTIKVWTRRSVQIYAEYALIQTEKTLIQLQQFIGIPNRLSKTDIVVVPEIEQQLSESLGMPVFTEYYVISEGEKASELQKTIVTASICHQLSRYWVGGLITPVNWDYSWLTEALAGYMEIFITPMIEPTLKTDEIFNHKVLQPTLWNEITNQRALTWHKKTATEMNKKYDLITYYKGDGALISYQTNSTLGTVIKTINSLFLGTSIIRMLEHIISKNSLRRVIQKYISDSLNSGLVSPNNLYDALEYQTQIDSFPLPSHVSITQVMKTWIENVGYPLITVIRDEQNTAVISQSTYNSPRAPKLPLDQEWIVPISYTTKSKAIFFNTIPSVWSFANKNITISHTIDENDWIICNLQQTGHYRVNYDSRNWDFLIKQLKENPEKIHHLNRAQLIDDSFSLAFDDILSYKIPLKLAEYLQQETEILPLESAVFHLDILFTKYEHTRNCIFIHKYIKLIFEKQIERIGFQVKKNESYVTKMGRPVVLSLLCRIGIPACVEPVLNKYKQNIQDISKVQPNSRKLVFCTALRWSENPQEIYNNLWNFYQKSVIAFDKRSIIESLACTRDEELLIKVLSKLFQSSSDDEQYIYNSILSTSKGVTAALKFVQSLIPTLSDLNDHGLSFLKKLLNDLNPKIHSETHVKLLKILENEFKRLDQEKYGEYVDALHNARSQGIQRVRENNAKGEVLIPILMDILDITPPNTPSPRPSSTVTTSPLMFLHFSSLLFFFIYHF